MNLKADHVLHHQTPTTNQLFTSVSLAAVLRLRISFQVAIQDRFILCEYKWVIPGEQRGYGEYNCADYSASRIKSSNMVPDFCDPDFCDYLLFFECGRPEHHRGGCGADTPGLRPTSFGYNKPKSRDHTCQCRIGSYAGLTDLRHWRLCSYGRVPQAASGWRRMQDMGVV